VSRVETEIDLRRLAAVFRSHAQHLPALRVPYDCAAHLLLCVCDLMRTGLSLDEALASIRDCVAQRARADRTMEEAPTQRYLAIRDGDARR